MLYRIQFAYEINYSNQCINYVNDIMNYSTLLEIFRITNYPLFSVSLTVLHFISNDEDQCMSQGLWSSSPDIVNSLFTFFFFL